MTTSPESLKIAALTRELENKTRLLEAMAADKVDAAANLLSNLNRSELDLLKARHSSLVAFVQSHYAPTTLPAGLPAEPEIQEAFEAWWTNHGQFCRAGGGQYEKTFANAAWRHLFGLRGDDEQPFFYPSTAHPSTLAVPDTAPLDDEPGPTPEELAELEAEVEQLKRDQVCITHHYDIGDQRVFLRRVAGTVDAKRAALYLQFRCEEWFGTSKMLTNLGIASLLVTHYGFQHAPATEVCSVIDMYSDREAACGGLSAELVRDLSLYREGIREAMIPHLDG